MLRIVFKVIASLAGLAVLFYLLERNLKVFEPEVIEPNLQPRLSKAKAGKQQTTKNSKANNTSAKQSDNLKLIKGIGPVIEEKLNAMGIFTFEQLANLSAEDITHINEELLEFAGRMERDQWMEQARELSTHKNSKAS